ncbi:MAG: hypothetical protein ACRC4T_18635 [Cetobacterium sp.]
MANYIFVINDINYPKVKFSAETVVNLLLDKNRWLLMGKGTPHLYELRTNDHITIYMAGKGRRYFLCCAQIQTSIQEVDLSNVEDTEFDLYNLFNYFITLKNINFFENKKYMKDLIEDLSFIKDKNNYGLYLRRSIKKINDEDFIKIS